MNTKWLFSVAIVIFAALTSAIAWYSAGVASDKAEVAKMVSVADRIQAPQTWILQDEAITGGFLCNDIDIACSSLSRRYTTDVTFNPDELRKIGARANWELKVEGDCRLNPSSLGTQLLCKATAQDDGYFISMSVVARGDSEPQELSVYVEKLRDR